MRLFRLSSVMAVSVLAVGVVTAAPAAAAAPAVTLTPSSLTFADQAIGTTSAAQSVTVANTGDASLFINSAAVPNTLDFTVVDDGCSGLTLPAGRSEEHTSELQSRRDLVCRLLLEKKKNINVAGRSDHVVSFV